MYIIFTSNIRRLLKLKKYLSICFLNINIVANPAKCYDFTIFTNECDTGGRANEATVWFAAKLVLSTSRRRLAQQFILAAFKVF